MSTWSPSLSESARALAGLARGEVVVGVDEDSGCCDLLVLARRASTSALATLIRLGAGFVCVTVDPMTASRLHLPPMAWAEQPDRFLGRLGVTVDAVHDTTTGISAHDRAITIRALCDPQSQFDSFTRPGHVVPVLINDDRLSGDDRPALIAHAGRIAANPSAPDMKVVASVAFTSLVSARNPHEIATPSQATDPGLAVLHYSDIARIEHSRRSAA